MRRIAGWMVGAAIVGALGCSDVAQVTDPCEEGGPGCDFVKIDGAALFSKTCGGCHSIERAIVASITTMDEAWALLREMTDHGVSLTEPQCAAIAEYLCDLKGCVGTE